MNSIRRIIRQVAPAFACGVVLGLAAGCNGDNSVSSGSGLTESDAALIIASSFGAGTSTYGLTGQIEDAASLAIDGLFKKPGTFEAAFRETTITRQKTGGVYTFDYTFHYLYGLAGDSLEFLYDMKGTYATPRMSSNDSANAVLHFTNRQGNPIVLNGTYVRLGSQIFRVGDTKELTTSIQGTLAGITIDRISRQVTGGTVALSITAGRDDGSTITLNGTLTFLADRQARLVLNGKTFTLNFNYAEADPA